MIVMSAATLNGAYYMRLLQQGTAAFIFYYVPLCQEMASNLMTLFRGVNFCFKTNMIN